MRMTILSRYLLRHFMGPFGASFGGLCTIILVTHIFERMDKFIEGKATLGTVIGYLTTMMPFQCLEALPVAVLMAILFVLGNLQRSNELVAMVTGGVPPERCLGVFLAAGLVLSAAGLVAHETFIPRATEYSRKVYRTQIRHIGEWRQVTFDNQVVAGEGGRFWHFGRLNTAEGWLTAALVDSYKEGRIVEQIHALQARKTGEGWMFRKGAVRRYGEDGVTIESNEPFEELLRPFPESVETLVPSEPHPEEMNSFALAGQIRRMRAMGLPTRRLEVELHAKLAIPLASLVVVCLGVPLGLARRTGRFRAVVYTLALSFSYFSLFQFGRALAQTLVSPWIGAWLANIFCLGLAAVLWVRRRVLA